jgi:DNA-binding MarR family transcriptional regulator
VRGFLNDSLHYLAARVAHRVGKHFYHEHLKPRGVRPDEYWVLTLLEECDGLTVTTIAANIGSDQPATTRLLDRMAEQGLIIRRTSLHDRRKVLAFITDHGHQLVCELEKLADEDERLGARSFTPEELEDLKAALRKLLLDLGPGEAVGVKSPEQDSARNSVDSNGRAS